MTKSSRPPVRADEAALEAAAAARPDDHEAHLRLGLARLSAGRTEEARQPLQRAAALAPRDPRPHTALAALAMKLGRHDDAIAAYRGVAAGESGLGDLLNNLGVALDSLGRRDESVAALRTAALLLPESASVQDNLGNVLLSMSLAREAEHCHRRALALGAANNGTTWSNLGNSLHRLGRLEESEAAYRRAIALSPNVARFHTNLALTLLLAGKFREGWEEYEWRWRDHANFPPYLRDRPWRGEAMPNGTLLLQAEQGYGDTVQFARYARLARARVGRVILACQPELVRLMRTVPWLDEVVPETAPVPAFDGGLTLMSLAGMFGTDGGADTIPGGVPYLSVPAGAGIRLPEAAGFKVGIAWAGRPTHGDDWNRSIPARLLAPLLAVPGVSFFSLQRGAVAGRLGRPPAGAIAEVADLCADFADTAQVVAAMDLIISVDTAVVHVAGAMGKPVWVLLPPVPDFRWRMGGDATPWYPSLRLFRRGFETGWEPVVAELARRLADICRQGSD